MIRIAYFLVILSGFFITLLYADETHPQGIKLDGSIGNAGNIEIHGPDYRIVPEYGKQVGSNLFHSFQNFNVYNGESATFLGPDSVKNIISRVTGGSESWIDGKLASTIPNADLYFLNPAGVMLGGNASLDLKGSFHVSTADYLRMGDSERFYSKPMTGEILSVAAPTAFGFLSDTPAKISIQGRGYVSPDSYEDEIFKGLRVFGNNSFSIIGGDIGFINGKYTTIDDDNLPLGALAIPEKGRINLASAASAGEVILKPDGIDITSEKLGTIRVSEESALHVGGGQIYIRSGSFVADKGYINAGEIDLPNGKIIGGNNGLVDINVNRLLFSNDSNILIQTLGAGDAGNVNIQARKADFSEGSGITSAAVGSGDAGSVKIKAGSVGFTEQSGINSSSFAQGNGGDVIIRAEESVRLSNSGIYSGTFSQENNAGSAGKVHIITPELILSDTSRVWASTAGQGNAGWINFEISELEMSGKSSVASDSLSESAGGKGGGILIGQSIEQTGNTHTISQPVQHIRMQDQSYIGTSARGEGNAGGVAIAVSNLDMDSGSIISSSSRQGEGGGIVLGKHIEVSIIDKSYLQEMDDTAIQVDQPADMIRIQNQSGISVSVEGEKNAGGIAIAAKELDMDNDAFIISSGKSSGSGGVILIGGSVSELENNNIQLSSKSDAIRICNHSVVSTSASGQGNAGAIFMRSSNLELDSGAAVASASLSETDGGNAGVIEIHAENISLENSAKISTSSNGQGDGGTIILETSRLDMDTEASISSFSKSEGESGDGGVIIVAGGIEEIEKNLYAASEISDKINIQNTAEISTSSAGTGDAGAIFLFASEIAMDSSASVSSASLYEQNGGHGGIIQIFGEYLKLENHAGITTSSSGQGNAGAIFLLASQVDMDSGASVSSLSKSETDGGDGGGIFIMKNRMMDDSGSTLTFQASDRIRLQNHASVSTSSSGQGDAGNILLATSELDMDSSSSISSGSLSEGRGGEGGGIGIGKEIVMKNADTDDERFSVTQPADTIRLRNHANINTSGKGYGNAGEIGLGVSDLELDSNAFISSIGKNGQGGMIIIAGTIDEPENEKFITPEFTDHIRLHGNSAITTSSEGVGDAGDIRLKVRRFEMHDASISSDASFSGGGIITVSAENTVWLTDSRITTNVYRGIGNGGDIGIRNPEFVILNYSEIQANAQDGDGGAVFIITDNFLKSFSSIVEATSERGNEGTVEIEAPDLDISGNLVVMPQTFLDAGKWIYDSCESRSGKERGRFTIRRYVVPPDPLGEISEK